MKLFYDLAIQVFNVLTPLVKRVNPKLKLFVEGRKNVFQILDQTNFTSKKTIWFHVASLGEYEQSVPVIQQVKHRFTDHFILVTFFSPSGYEHRKNSSLADLITYLPLDTVKNAQRFVETVQPAFSFFVKYDLWPNYLYQLKKNGGKVYLISGVFKKSQPYFKWYGGFLRKALNSFDYFFLQNETSKQHLHSLGFTNTLVSGDTRFDRVAHQIEQDNSVRFIEEFLDNELCLVCGSTWPEDEAILADLLDSELIKTHPIKIIIAPHEVDHEHITQLQRRLTLNTVRFSTSTPASLKEAQVLIIDAIGFLSRAYSYADIAYIGGAMGNTGLHNILEPATFGIPVIIGRHFDDFPEAKKLRQLAGLYSVSTSIELQEILRKLITDKKFRRQTGMICGHYINSNTGATNTIMDYIEHHTETA